MGGARLCCHKLRVVAQNMSPDEGLGEDAFGVGLWKLKKKKKILATDTQRQRSQDSQLLSNRKGIRHSRQAGKVVHPRKGQRP